MRAAIIISLCLLTGCLPDTDTYTIRKGSTWVRPYFKYRNDSPILNINVRFDSTCIYPPQRVECEGDWSKLIYFGTLNPHHNGAAYVWRCVGADRHLEIGYYLWYNGEAPFTTGRMGVIQVVTPGEWYNLKIDLRNGVTWIVQGAIVHHFDLPITDWWITQGWFSGEDNSGRDCPTGQQITYTLQK